jgi:hypothetical protein
MVFVNAEPPAAHTLRPRAMTRTPMSPTRVACGFAVTAIRPAMGGVGPEFPGVAKPMGAARAPGISVGQPTAEQFDRNCSIRNRTKQECLPDDRVAPRMLWSQPTADVTTYVCRETTLLGPMTTGVVRQPPRAYVGVLILRGASRSADQPLCSCLIHVANGFVSSLWRLLAGVDGRGPELLRTRSAANRRRPRAHERLDAYRNYGAARCSAAYRGPSCTGTQQDAGR